MAERLPDTLADQIVSLRLQGMSLREIGQSVGRCMETVRQVVLRKAKAAREDDNEVLADTLIGEREALPVGHEVPERSLWRGLERYRQHEGRNDRA